MKRTTITSGTAIALHELLLQLGADKVVHSGRTLYEHLCGVELILSAWRQPQELRNAGLFHSVYSTEQFKHAVLPMTERPRLQRLIGPRTERIVYLFSVLRRKDLFDSCSSVSPDGYAELPSFWDERVTNRVSGSEAAQVVLLHMANRLEQAQKRVTGIGFWLSFMCDRVRSLRASGISLPDVLTTLGTITPDDERRLLSEYLQGIRFLQDGDPRSALEHLKPACANYGVVGEPYLMLAVAHRLLGDVNSARRTAPRGLELLKAWGAPWHKRVST